MIRALVPLLVLTACAPSAPGAAGPSGGIALAGVRCPPPGTVVQRNDGRVRYDGAAADDPAVCVVLRNDGTRVRVLAALYTLPARDEGAIRRGLALLFPLASGREGTFRRDVAAYGLPDQSVQVSETLRVVGEETLVIGGAPRPVWVIQRTSRNVRLNTTQEATWRVDRETGAPLASTGAEGNTGAHWSRSFQATGLSVRGAAGPR